MTKTAIPHSHPRAESLQTREKLIEGFDQGVVAVSGLIAHGRGEAFDYLAGETTSPIAVEAIRAGAATLALSQRPVISVNGNAAALSAREIVKLARVADAGIEVNLFYRSLEREKAIRDLLMKAGAKFEEVLGVGSCASATIPELFGERRRVDPRGILSSDVVLVPLEDGDRTEALVKMGKKVIAVDLNPLSRTAQKATVTIVDNMVRVLPQLAQEVTQLRHDMKLCRKIISKFDNKKNLSDSIDFVGKHLSKLAKATREKKLGET